MIQELATYEALAELSPEWSELWDRSAGATPFQSPEWLLAWWRHLFCGGQMWTIAAREGGRLTALAPLFVYGQAGEPRRVAFIGAGVSDYSGILAESARAAQEVCSHIAASSTRWDICDFPEIRADSPLLSASFAPLETQRCVSSVCPVVRLPATMAEFEARLPPKFRHNLRNSRNRLRDAGAVLETALKGQDEEYVEALFRLHAARWRSKGEDGVLCSPATQSFFREACRGFRRRGWLRFHGLRFQGKLCAIVCIFCSLRRSVYYIGGFADELLRYSPGSAMIEFAIERAIAEQVREFDFLRLDEKYKYRWGATDRINTRVVIRTSESESSAAGR